MHVRISPPRDKEAGVFTHLIGYYLSSTLWKLRVGMLIPKRLSATTIPWNTVDSGYLSKPSERESWQLEAKTMALELSMK